MRTTFLPTFPRTTLASLLTGLCALPLCAAEPTSDVVIAADALSLSLGDHTCADDSLGKITSFTIAGTFFSNQYVSPKFPCGGALHVGTRAAGTPTARLNPAAVITLAGGYLHLIGQGLEGKPDKPGDTDISERIRQLRLVSGMSEIRIENGNDVSRSTVLSITDPGAGIVRQRGATVVVSGDERRSKAGANSPSGPQAAFSATVGAVEKIRVASGMSADLKGTDGSAGSATRSIIPWMVIGSYLQPGMGGVATYDPEVGVRALTANEYDKKLKGSPERNVWTDNLELGDNQQQTVNALVFVPYFSSQLGNGSTLTITSGFLQFGQRGPSTIGSHPQGGDYVSTGTIDFGAAEGVIWTCFEPEWGPNVIGPVIAGSGGVTIAGSNTLILHGANTYTGTTCVSDGVLQIGDVFPTKARLGAGNVEIAAGAMLRIKANVSDAIADSASVTLLTAALAFAGVLELENGVNETVSALVIDGKTQAAGTYGSSTSAAVNKLDRYFSGAGVLTVRAR